MKKIILLLFVILSACGVYLYQNSTQSANSQSTFYGNIENRTQKLSFTFLGTVKCVTKDEGQKFSKGDVLASLDTTPLHYQIEQLEAQIEAERTILQKLKSGYRTEEIAQAKAAMQEAKASLDGAKDTYVRQKQLYEHKTTAEQSYVLAKTAYEKAQAIYDKAISSYALMKKGYQQEDIEAQAKKVAALKAQKKTLQYNLQEATITAPTDGTILTRYVEPKSVVTPAQSIVEVALQDEYWVRAYIGEAELGKIKQGQKMLVYTDVREEPYEGYVGFISPVAEFTPKNIETPEARPNLVYRFRVIITNPSAELKQGLPVTVKTL
ncbi:HlyD family efflux transporter periplasmic adaptor subunit [Sulfurimonas sp. C5]|uniref:HlyD family efflux transporter periplasmic adaptor subunit n=1 Tax=Sulfurimonas sp. C5 TaxID=3036947 RepID=UPI002453B617|nr:HlyD family efflux transporter periplasmic adaptor subunit [Sulfurimonas sp. C5]MDH4945022.1 HlyD family efflux transporter periplasmic adaptor subunit [Sulfurimonas sp. C5]